MFYSTEEAVKQTLKDIEDMQQVNAILPEIKKIVTKWDGKCFNKRFQSDLEALKLPGRIYLYTHYETTYEVHYQPKNSNKWYTVFSGVKPGTKYYRQDNSFLNEDKRLNKQKTFEIIEQRRVERLQNITKYREHLATYEEKQKQLETLEKAIKAITDTIPCEMQNYFRMYYRVSRS